MINTNKIVDILLVEDNPTDAELEMRALKKARLANNIEWVKDGEAALDYLFRHGEYSADEEYQHPRLALLDLRLPKLDGIDVLKAIRGHEATREIPVVILTSSKEERDVVAAYDLGVNSYVSKPIAFDEFTETVANLGMYWLLINQPPPQDD